MDCATLGLHGCGHKEILNKGFLFYFIFIVLFLYSYYASTYV